MESPIDPHNENIIEATPIVEAGNTKKAKQEAKKALEDQKAAEEKDALETKIVSLLSLLKITNVYYIDDENGIEKIDFEIVSAELIKIYDSDKQDKLEEINYDNWNLALPSDLVIEQLRKIWDGHTFEEQKSFWMALSVISNETQEITLDLERIKKFSNAFPHDMLMSISPIEWEDKKKDFLSGVTSESKALIIFDEDLKYAGPKYVAISGHDLIVDLKAANLHDNVVCALLTHKIQDTNQELAFRDKILEDNHSLHTNDFFPLAKVRLDNLEVFADGLKKTLINSYFERIKAHTVEMIKFGYEKAIERIKNYDTYDFDSTILKSSLQEGVWEPMTIIRVLNISFEHNLKKKMADTDYAAKVNTDIKAVHPFKDYNFNIPSGMQPYTDKFFLRHEEIYENGDIINSLRKPLESGDIFELDGHPYILVGQACDLMVRSSPSKLGSRNAKTATLLKINLVDKKDFEKEMTKKHYLRDKSSLPYYSIDGSKINFGLAEFTDFIVVDINCLDLCVYNSNGDCKIDLNIDPDFQFVQYTMEARYSIILKALFSSISTKIIEVNDHLISVHSDRTDDIIKAFYPKLVLSSTENLSNDVTYGGGVFNFNIKRTMKLRDLGSTYLLERYTRHLSRVAEPHDFAK